MMTWRAIVETTVPAPPAPMGEPSSKARLGGSSDTARGGGGGSPFNLPWRGRSRREVPEGAPALRSSLPAFASLPPLPPPASIRNPHPQIRITYPPSSGARNFVVLAAAFLSFLFLAAASPAHAQTIIYVNAAAAPGGNGQTWGSAYNDLVVAMVEAESVPPQSRNIEIWVAQGVYRPTNPLARRNSPDPRSASFKLLNGVALYGGFVGDESALSQRNWLTNQTVLSGDLAANDSATAFDWSNHGDNVYTVVWARSNYRTAVLDGFVVTGGNSVIDGTFGLPPGVTNEAADVPYVNQGGGIFAYHDVTPQVAGPSIRNCWVTRNVASYCAGYNAIRSGGELLNCRFTLNEAVRLAGAIGHDGSAGTHTIAGCLIADNRANEGEAGISFYGDGSQVVNCTIVRNECSVGGLPAVNVGRGTMRNSIVFFNTPGPFQIRDQLSTTITDCAVEGGLGGIDSIGTVGNIYSGAPGFVNPYGPDSVAGTSDDDWRLQPISPYIDVGEDSYVPGSLVVDIDRRIRIFDFGWDGVSAVDLGAHEAGSPVLGDVGDTVFVRADAPFGGTGVDWSNAVNDLQHALAISAASSSVGEDVAQIWVAGGTYTPSPPLHQGGFRSASFRLQSNLAIYGGFAGNESELSQRDIAANPTILSGDLNGDDTGDLNRADNSTHVVLASGVGATARLDGFTVTAGESDNDAGGLFITGSGSPSVSRCTFRLNSAINGGAVVVRVTSPAFPRFEQCVFDRNMAGGAGGAFHHFGPGISEFHDSTFVDNTSDAGGAVHLNGSGSSAATFTRCQFLRNSAASLGGAIDMRGGAVGSFVSCLFLANAADGSAAIYANNSTISIAGSAFIGNTAGSSSSAVGVRGGSSVSMTNSTIAFNRSLAPIDGAISNLDFLGTQFTLSNCILWGNRRGDSLSQEGQIATGPYSLSHCIVEGWNGSAGGVGNSAIDPRFRRMPSPGADNVWGTIDDDYGDLRVTNGSPAIDSGNSLAVPLDVYDIDADGNTTESLPLDLDGLARFVDDPLVANTGIGNPPVDRGPYEFVPPIITAPGERRWVSPSGGDFASLFNWFPAVPGALDDAVFDIPSAYTVNFPLSPPAQTRTARVSRGVVALDLNGSTFNISAASEPALIVGDLPGNPAALVITDGTVAPFSARIGAEAGSLGSVTVTGNTGRLSIAQDDLSVGFFGQGHLTITGGADVVSRTAGVGDQPGSGGSSVVLTGPGSTWNIPFFLAINNGSVNVSDQAVLSAGFGVFLFQNGTISGNGTINATVVNFGTIEPGNSPGTLTINGAYNQVGVIPELGANSGKLRSQVSGSLPGQFDKLMVNGQATLGGGLFVEFMDGYVPTPNGQGQYPAIDLLQSTQPLVNRFDVAFFPSVPPVQGQNPKFLRAIYPNRGPGTVQLIVADLGTNPDFDDPDSYQLDGGPTAADIGDLNGDGLPDLAIALPDVADPINNNGDVVVLFNLGNNPMGDWLGFGGLTQQVTVGKNPSGVAIGDFDGINGNDVAATNMNSNSVSILSQQVSSGTFVNALTVPVGNEPTALAAFNLDRVGFVDIAVANGADNTVMMMANTTEPGGGGGFAVITTVPTGVRPVAVRPFNPDNDKDLDVATANQGGSSMSVMPNQGFGTFGTPLTVNVGEEPVGLVAGSLLDRDPLDRRQDLVVINRAGGSVSVVVNTTPEDVTNNLSFAPAVESVLATQSELGSLPRSVAMVDLDDDGDLDVAVLARDQEDTATAVRLLRNDLNGGEQLAFVESAQLDAGLGPVAVLTGDVDADGRPDLITVNGGGRGPGAMGTVQVLRNALAALAPPCRADFDGNDLVQVPDIFAFLGAWFSQQPAADFDGNPGIQVPDIFAFLALWFAGCP